MGECKVLTSSELHDELECYLSTDPEHVNDICAWWYERREAYPCLHSMALNYHTVSGAYVLLKLGVITYQFIYLFKSFGINLM